MSNSALSERQMRFHIEKGNIVESGLGDSLPNVGILQLIVTDGAMHLLARGVDNADPVRKVIVSSDPKGPDTVVFEDEPGTQGFRLRNGARVQQLLDISDEEFDTVRALLISLQAPRLEVDQIKAKDRPLLKRHGYIDSTDDDFIGFTDEEIEVLLSNKILLSYEDFVLYFDNHFYNFRGYFLKDTSITAYGYRERPFFQRFMRENSELDQELREAVRERPETYPDEIMEKMYLAYTLLFASPEIHSNRDLFK